MTTLEKLLNRFPELQNVSPAQASALISAAALPVNSNLVNTLFDVARTVCKVGATTKPDAVAPWNHLKLPIVGLDSRQPGLDSVVPITTATSATQVCTREEDVDWSAGDSTVNAIFVPHKTYAQVCRIENSLLQNGARLEMLLTKNIRELVNALDDARKSLFTVANFGAAATTVSATDFSQGYFAQFISSLSTQTRVCEMATGYAAKITPYWMPETGNTTVYESSRWTAADTNVAGAVYAPESVIIRHGLPVVATPSRTVLTRETFTLPNIGLPCEASLWFDLQSRSLFAGYCLLAGFAVGDAGALKLLTSQ